VVHAIFGLSLIMHIVSCFIPISNHHLMEIPSCMYFTFDVSLFWMMTKHKGQSHGLDEMQRWLHWIYDFI
jgi:hypothetical protein